jgi:uncharacterized protein (TIGR00255 family)
MAQALRSMTGFGEAQGQLSARWAATVRVAALNGRSLEVALRLQPRLDLPELEPAVRRVLAEAMERGRVQVGVELQALAASRRLDFDWQVAEALVIELKRRPRSLKLAPISLRDLLALPGFAAGSSGPALDAGEVTALLELLAGARDRACAMREEEAKALSPVVAGELDELERFAAWLAEVLPQVRTALLEKLRSRLGELLQGVVLPEERLLTEAALGAERADATEELERLRSHLGQFRATLAAGGPVGKRLDFLLQEMLREVNTAASKCREAGVGERVVAAKAALDKLREQCANLE